MSPTRIQPAAIKRARSLRRNMTEGEKRLWSELRQFRRLYGIHVRRQVPLGPFVVDFIIHSASLVIEVDGEHHLIAERMVRDLHRDAWLKTQGFRVLRFTTGDLSDNFDGCIEELLRELGLT